MGGENFWCARANSLKKNIFEVKKSRDAPVKSDAHAYEKQSFFFSLIINADFNRHVLKSKIYSMIYHIKELFCIEYVE